MQFQFTYLLATGYRHTAGHPIASTDKGQTMISIRSAAKRTMLFVLASSLTCAAALANTQAPRADASAANANDAQARNEVAANWATPPAPVAASKWQDSLPPAPPVAPREEKILPKSEWLSVEPMKEVNRRCDPGLDALFLSKECGKDPSWLGSRKK